MLKVVENYNIVLTSELNTENEKNKSDISKENAFYSLINKKRKRHYSKRNYKIYKCPSCASSSLSKIYWHIHEKNKFRNYKNKSLLNKENQKIILKVEKIYCEKEENNDNHEDIKDLNDMNKKIGNNDYLKDDIVSDNQKKEKEKKNIFESKLIRNAPKNNKVNEIKKNDKKIILQIDKIFCP